MEDAERKKIVIDFFKKANSKNLLIYNKFNTYPIPLQKSMKNRVEENKTFKQVVHLFKDSIRLKQLVDFNQISLGIKDMDTRRILSHYIIFHGFNIIEMHKAFLTQLINPEIPIGKKKLKIKNNSTLNQMVYGLSQELKFPDFEKLFPSKLRNILGHSNWFFENSKFCFIHDEDKQICFTVTEFIKEIKELDKNMNLIVTEWISKTKQKTP